MKSVVAAFAASLLFASGAGGAAPPAVDQALVDGDTMPPKLSAFGLFAGNDPARPVASFAYTLNTPLFSDYAEKHRFVSIPAGKKAEVADDGTIAFPVGTVIVKTSAEVKDGRATGEAGPIFVMEKRAAGFDAEHGDWAYAIHWADPPARWRAKLGGPIYWRSPSHKVGYCVECHDNYDRNLGDVPGPQKITTLPE